MFLLLLAACADPSKPSPVAVPSEPSSVVDAPAAVSPAPQRSRGSTSDGAPEPTSGPQALKVVVDGRPPVVLDATTLDGLERIADPRGRLLGWDLVDVLRLAVGSDAAATVSVVYADPGKAPVPLGALHGGDTYCIVKHSKGGELRLQEWSNDARGGRPEGVHRAVSHLAVELRASP